MSTDLEFIEILLIMVWATEVTGCGVPHTVSVCDAPQETFVGGRRLEPQTFWSTGDESTQYILFRKQVASSGYKESLNVHVVVRAHVRY